MNPVIEHFTLKRRNEAVPRIVGLIRNRDPLGWVRQVCRMHGCARKAGGQNKNFVRSEFDRAAGHLFENEVSRFDCLVSSFLSPFLSLSPRFFTHTPNSLGCISALIALDLGLFSPLAVFFYSWQHRNHSTTSAQGGRSLIHHSLHTLFFLLS